MNKHTQIGQAHAGILAESVLRHEFSASYFRSKLGQEGFALDSEYSMDEMEAVLNIAGVGFKDTRTLDSYVDFAMDNIQQPLTTPNLATPLQFLQNWLPGIVQVVTAARKIDELVGRSTVGSWEDEQIVQQVIELTGAPVPYTDLGNVPLSSWNPTFVTRTVCRFELGFRVGNLEELRSSRMRIDSAGQKRASDALQLEIQRNAVGFYGYNSGNGLTYGFLNDPNLPAYVNAAHGAWASATFLQIQSDLLTALQTLRTQSQDRISPDKDPITLAISTNRVDYLSVTSDFGISVSAWLHQFYPNVRVESAPQLNAANGGANVFYLYADSVKDSGTDDQKTFIQVVPATFQLMGIQKMVKGFEEDYSNATAGIMLKRPYAVVRVTGI